MIMEVLGGDVMNVNWFEEDLVACSDRGELVGGNFRAHGVPDCLLGLA